MIVGDLKSLFLNKQIIVMPSMMSTEKVLINDALRIYKQFRPKEIIEIDNTAVLVSGDYLLYEEQFRLIIRAILLYKLNMQEGTSNYHTINRTIHRLKGRANKYGLDKDMLVKLVACESGLNPLALNPKDPITRSVGILQFKDKTWASYGYGDIWDWKAQLAVGIKMMANKEWYHWQNCYNKIYERNL